MMNKLKHLAIIMDGNGRWAKRHGFIRTKGHEKGAKVVRSITQTALKSKVKFITLFAFSTENWARPKTEVEFLMKLLEKYLDNELEFYITNNVRFLTIGDMSKFSPSLISKIESVKKITSKNNAMTQILAINYGGKNEIVERPRV